MMNELLDSQIKGIEKLVRAKDPAAVERAAQLAEQYPDEPEVWFSLAFAHAMNDDMDGAVAAMNRLVDIAPREPAVFFDRGRYEQSRGNLQAALADFTQGIALCEQLHWEYYLESLYFFRADVLVALGRKAEALADLEHVEDDHVAWTTKLRTKAAILADCGVPRKPWRAMSEPLDSLLDEIEIRVPDEEAAALERAEQLTEQYPEEPEVWRTLAHVYATKGDWDSSVAAITRMIEVTPPHPRMYFYRGHYEHKRGNLQAALADFDRAVARAKELHEEDGWEKLYFMRADVLAALGRKAEARADLVHVPDGYVGRTNRIRTKAEILEDCEE
jgi:tetratricopeptide (TPR) repeat protein